MVGRREIRSIKIYPVWVKFDYRPALTTKAVLFGGGGG